MNTVLVLDREPGIRSLISIVLSAEGYQVLEAVSPADVCQLLESEPISLLLIDTTTCGILPMECSLPTIYMSAGGCRDMGMAVLEKPFEVSRLNELVKRMLPLPDGYVWEHRDSR